jgi:hypothetical protein
LAVFLVLGILPGLLSLNANLMLGYDDNWLTTSNPLIVHGPLYFFTQLFKPFGPQTEIGFETGHWAPLSYLSVAIDHFIFGKGALAGVGPRPSDFTPWALRLISCLYHGLCGWLVFLIGRRWIANQAAAFFGALIFLLHPTICESVCWVVERNNILPALFGLLSLYVYSGGNPDPLPHEPEGPSWRRTFAAFGLLLASQLSKASGVSWWPVLVAWDFLISRRRKQFDLRRVARSALLLLPIAMSIFVVTRSHKDSLIPPLGDPPLGPWISALVLLARYFILLIYPVNLSAFYHVSAHPSLMDPQLTIGFFSLVLLCIWARSVGIPARRLNFYLIWMVSAVAPIINPFVQTSFLLQDRYLYVALPAFGMLTAEIIYLTAAKLDFPQVLSRGLAGAVVALLAAMSIARSAYWQNENKLFADAVQKQPASGCAHAFYARHLVANVLPNTPDEEKPVVMKLAMQEHKLAMDCDDFNRIMFPLHHIVTYAEMRLMIGDDAGGRNLLLQVWNGRPERLMERGSKLRAVRLLAKNAMVNGQGPLALDYVQKGLELSPGDADLLFTRVRTLYAMGRKDDARSEAERIHNPPPEIAPMLDAFLRAMKAEPPALK